jgi:hypothetical protein
MARAPIDTPRTVSLEIKVKLAHAAAGHPQAAVYAFGRSGQLIDKIAADPSGHAKLHLPDLRVMQEVRVMVGPEAQAEQATVAELSRRGAREQFVRISPAIEPPALEFEIQPALYSSWSRRCRVHGSLYKRHEDRQTDTPIGGANVQIWEIEPVELMIAKLPDAVINDFRDLILEVAGRHGARADRASVRAARVQSAKPLVGVQMHALESSSHFAALVAAADETAAGLRDHLVRTAASVRLLLCLLYPAWIRKYMLASATTDADGRFQALVFPSNHCPSVNLYFTASAAYRGSSLPVYDPKPVACFTYWDYREGTDVALLATSDATGAIPESLARDAAWTPVPVIAAGSV